MKTPFVNVFGMKSWSLLGREASPSDCANVHAEDAKSRFLGAHGYLNQWSLG
jgi:hypothetical protein